MFLPKWLIIIFCVSLFGCSSPITNMELAPVPTNNTHTSSVSSGTISTVSYSYSWWGLRDKYKFVKDFVGDVGPVIDHENRVGILNIKGDIIIPFGKYSELDDSYDTSGFIGGEDSDNKCVLINSLGQEVLKRDCSWLGDVHEGVFVFNEPSDPRIGRYNSKYGMQNIDGTVLVKNMGYIDDLHDGMAIFSLDPDSRVEDMKIGFLDSSGRIAISPKYGFESNAFSGGYAVVSKKGLFGVIDKKDNTIIDFKYDYISDFYGEFAFAGRDGTCGRLDIKGVYHVFSGINGACELDYSWASIGVLHIPDEAKNIYANNAVVNMDGESIIPGFHTRVDITDNWIITQTIDSITDFNDAETTIYNHSGAIVLKIPGFVIERGTYFYGDGYYYYADGYRVKD